MKTKIKNIIIVLLSILLVFLLLYSKEDKKENLKELEINYIDVGQGNAVLIKTNNKTILIDGGNRSNSRYYYNFIKNKNIKKIDYMIVSHYDEDHISGLISILENFEVSNVLCPDYKKDTKIYKSFKNSLKKSKANIIYPKKGDNFNISDARIKILWPNEYKNNIDNDNSIILKLIHGNMSFLFTGDASINIENQLIYSGFNLKSDVVMLGHHGSKYSTSNEFLEEVDPKLAIISVGNNNRYGHPSNRVLKLLNNKNIKFLRTDIDGDITIKCDGNKIKVNTNKSNKNSKINLRLSCYFLF